MTATLEQIAARLAVLEDKEAIRALKARYLRACDLKQPDVVRDCFLPVGARVAYQWFPVFDNRDDFVAIYTKMACQGGVYDIHHATNWDIELTGPDEARGLWSLSFRTILTGPRQVHHTDVEYQDVYRRQDGRWWIAESVSYVISSLAEQIAEDGTVTVLSAGERPGKPG